MHALTNQPYQETTTLQSAIIGMFQPVSPIKSTPSIQPEVRRYDLWDLHVSLHKNPRVTSYLRPVHLVILGHGTQLPPPTEGEVKTAGGAEPILRQPGGQLHAALAATS